YFHIVIGVTVDFTSERNLLVLGIESPSFPNHTLLSLNISLYFSFEYSQLLPDGGKTFLPEGVVISYIFFSIAGLTEKSDDFHGPLSSLSGLLYLSLVALSLFNPLLVMFETFFPYTKIKS